MTTAKTACILCSRNCGLTVEITEHKFVKINGDHDHPISKGYICQKAAQWLWCAIQRQRTRWSATQYVDAK